mgnify:CR=1 FL=1
MNLYKIKVLLPFALFVLLLAAISSKDSALFKENAFDIAELFTVEDQSISAGDVVVLADTKYDYRAVAEELDLDEYKLKKKMEEKGAEEPLEMLEELENGAESVETGSSLSSISGNAISEAGLETDLTSILEPSNITASNATADTSSEANTTQTSPRLPNLSNDALNNNTNKKDRLLASKAAVVALTNIQNDPNIIGVVSSKPAYIMGFGSDLKDMKSVPVALAGRVPVKVTLENGNIETGDPLTSSSKPGYAMKAVKSGRIIGYALESFNAKSKTGKILVFINAGWYNAPEQIATLPQLPKESITQAPQINYITKVNGSVIIRLG